MESTEAVQGMEVVSREGATAGADAFPLAEAIEALRGPGRVAIQGEKGGLQAAVLAELARALEKPLIIVTDKDGEAERLAEDVATFMGSDQVAWLPGVDVGPFYQATADRRVTLRRLAGLYRLQGKEPPAVTVASIQSVMRRTLPLESFRAHTHVLGVGETLTNETARQWMGHCGYTEVSLVEDPGTFAVRGDVIDLFPPHEAYPIRLERWGDEIAEIRRFHPESQRSLENLGEVAIYPVREAILDDASVKIAHRRLRDRNNELKKPFGELRDTLADLNAGLHMVGIEALLPALHPELEDLLAYAPADAVIALVEPEAITEAAEELWERRLNEWAASVEEGTLLFEAREYYRPSQELLGALRDEGRIQWRRLQMLESSEDATWPLPAAQVVFRVRENTDVVALRKANQGVEATVKAWAKELPRWREEYGRVAVVCRTRAQRDRLVELLKLHGETAMAVDPPLDIGEVIPPPAEILEVYKGELSTGFRSPFQSVALVSGTELFGQRVVTSAQRSFVEHASISHFKDLSEGDLVVHVDFGVGRYCGIVHVEVEGVGNDLLLIEYAGGDKLYLPVYRLSRVQKYIGAADGVALDKMGGTRWERTKEKVKENLREMAGELLALYARREMAKGITYSEPDEFYRKFEEAFPFEETPDQARAIRDVLGDMTRVRPMDRLICGDVGFGKTEVAIRAAMKAVADGRQVAVLVPTTLLAEQHLISFNERMEEFGVRCEALSRFRSSKQERQILEDTAKGKVDVLLGTHRLLSKDVEFARLGLLIVDEEQRFGVKHKEKIKRLRTDIDVLTLTATPIPRTLQMSLLGIRDLSIIATPPHNRLAVRTHVAKFSDSIIREALLRELSRGGQIFFVHNRVSTIQEMAEHLTTLLPEARIGIGHGQMAEGELEKVMVEYVQGRVNVLLCTSIVESGLDIPNANTIVVNRADLFGLSQLYQLRGRVGRGNTRAYAYLLVPGRRKLPDDAQKRLEVIQTYTDLGSGFQVASYDLEIRGAGNLLSDDQSGHVTAVGLDLYTELLEEAIHDLRDEEPDQVFDPEVNIAVEAYLPDTYVPATSLRLMFYKRFSLARTPEELEAIYEEMVDRFGDPPEGVRNLRQVVSIQVDLRRIRAHRLDAGMSAISIELDRTTTLNPGRVVDMVNQSGGRWRLTADMKLIYSLKVDESSRPLETSRQLLDHLLSLS